jgi:hypothetical protein
MADKVREKKDARQDPRQRLLRETSVRAIMKTWTPKMRDVGEDLSCLPVKEGKSDAEIQMNRWGFVFAIDALRDNPSAIQALFEALPELMDELKYLPQREEMFALVDHLLAFKLETKTSMKNHRAFQANQNQKPTGKVGFIRRN